MKIKKTGHGDMWEHRTNSEILGFIVVFSFTNVFPNSDSVMLAAKDFSNSQTLRGSDRHLIQSSHSNSNPNRQQLPHFHPSLKLMCPYVAGPYAVGTLVGVILLAFHTVWFPGMRVNLPLEDSLSNVKDHDAHNLSNVSSISSSTSDKSEKLSENQNSSPANTLNGLNSNSLNPTNAPSTSSSPWPSLKSMSFINPFIPTALLQRLQRQQQQPLHQAASVNPTNPVSSISSNNPTPAKGVVSLPPAPSPSSSPSPPIIELVISAYNEDLSWIPHVQKRIPWMKITLYCKEGPGNTAGGSRTSASSVSRPAQAVQAPASSLPAQLQPLPGGVVGNSGGALIGSSPSTGSVQSVNVGGVQNSAGQSQSLRRRLVAEVVVQVVEPEQTNGTGRTNGTNSNFSVNFSVGNVSTPTMLNATSNTSSSGQQPPVTPSVGVTPPNEDPSTPPQSQAEDPQAETAQAEALQAETSQSESAPPNDFPSLDQIFDYQSSENPSEFDESSENQPDQADQSPTLAPHPKLLLPEGVRCARVIPNYGSNEYTNLRHIVENYDTDNDKGGRGLASTTVFTLASILSTEWNMMKCRKLNFVLKIIEDEIKRERERRDLTLIKQGLKEERERIRAIEGEIGKERERARVIEGEIKVEKERKEEVKREEIRRRLGGRGEKKMEKVDGTGGNSGVDGHSGIDGSTRNLNLNPQLSQESNPTGNSSSNPYPTGTFNNTPSSTSSLTTANNNINNININNNNSSSISLPIPLPHLPKYISIANHHPGSKLPFNPDPTTP